MKLTTKSRYGARMILDIALHGGSGPVRVADIARRQGVSVKYLEKIIRELKKGGFIGSRRGPGGGHFLARPARDIRMGEVVRLLEAGSPLVKCVRDTKACKRSAECLMTRLWSEAHEAMCRSLDMTSLADLVEDAGSCPEAGA
ncbi:MAG: Rrf2 family transcriptional regulator [Desulfovibrionaceae bacterium]|nr:Rrf2 family transcriptional regulator [Desulfovibrionaceae bacterium]